MTKPRQNLAPPLVSPPPPPTAQPNDATVFSLLLPETDSWDLNTYREVSKLSTHCEIQSEHKNSRNKVEGRNAHLQVNAFPE